MIDLYLIRHGESEVNKTPQFIGGRTNHSPLSQGGIIQAERLGCFLHNQQVTFDEVYSSTAVRAIHTAKITCLEIGYPLEDIIQSEELLEISQGDWEGKLRAETYTPEVLKNLLLDTWNFKAPNGESQKEVEERGYAWIEKTLLSRSEKDLTVGVFTHGLTTRCILRKILNSDPSMTYYLVTDNTSITRLVYVNNRWRLIKLNETSHLYNY
ncbi:MAG: histidine phosphatase family protein [Candidatus Woesearchaeota archaeon]